jgi:hypothetical protein
MTYNENSNSSTWPDLHWKIQLIRAPCFTLWLRIQKTLKKHGLLIERPSPISTHARLRPRSKAHIQGRTPPTGYTRACKASFASLQAWFRFRLAKDWIYSYKSWMKMKLFDTTRCHTCSCTAPHACTPHGVGMHFLSHASNRRWGVHGLWVLGRSPFD